jgi:hypothetical protein
VNVRKGKIMQVTAGKIVDELDITLNGIKMEEFVCFRYSGYL